MSLSSKILTGFVAGTACGLIFGDYCGGLSIIGTAFIGLLRMTVMPYVFVSLIANFGKLSRQQSRRLTVVG